MARTRKVDMKMKDSPRVRTSGTPKHIRKPHLSIVSKHRSRKFATMLQKEKAIIREKLWEDTHDKRQEEEPSRRLTTLKRKGLNNKEKERANDPKASEATTQKGAPASDQRQSIQKADTGSLVQDLSSNSRFFEGSHNVKVKRGTFRHIHGNHTSLMIQINPSHGEEYETPQQNHLPQPVSPSQTPDHDSTMPPTQNIHRSQFHPTEICDANPSTLTSRTIYSPNPSNKIYERHLMLKERGFPLWIPEPDRYLPLSYRRKGVDIGDVGIITRSGAFAFLFNIRWPHDDPINPSTLPEGLSPLRPPLKPTDIRGYSEFKPESYLASAEIEKIHNDPPFRGLSFAASSAEGAVLTFPDGAIATDLANTRRFREYAKANIKEWYRYINGPLGLEAQNGEVRLITGCDKATSWGMAAVATMTQNRVHHLKYRSVEDSATTAPIPLYKWEHTGFAEARVGPDLQEIKDLKKEDTSNAALDGKYWNQCLFIRTLNIKLNPTVFAAVCPEPEPELVEEWQQFQDMGSPSTSTSSPSEASTHAGAGTDQQRGTHSGAKTQSVFESLTFSTEHLALDDNVREPVTTSIPPSAPKSHPADFLNNLLLQKFPNCEVVITQDKDWYSVINEDDKIMPSDAEIATRVLATHHIREEDGVVFLEPKKVYKVALPAVHPTHTTAPPIYNDSGTFDMGRYAVPLYNRPRTSCRSQLIDESHYSWLDVHGSHSHIGTSLLHSPSCRLEIGGHSADRVQVRHQPPSSDDFTSSSSASGTNFGYHNAPMGQTSGIGGYKSPPYPHGQTFGQAFPSSVEQGFGAFRGPQLVMQHSQFMPTQPHTDSHPPPSDYYTTPEGENMESYVNYSPNNSHSPASSTSTSFNTGRMQDPPRPTNQETEAYLRKSIPIPEGKPVNLWSLPDSTKAPKISDMIKLAVWGSQNHQLTLRQIYDEIESRYPHLKDATGKPWQRSIRHNLSLKAMFIREERPQSDPGKGYYWTLNVAMGEGNKRDRKRKRDAQNIKEEKDDTDFLSESQGYPETAPSPSSSQHWPPPPPPPHHRPDNTYQAIHMSANPQQSMMHGQMEYAAPPFQGTMPNQPAPGGFVPYNEGMGHSQNIPFHAVHAGNAFTQNAACVPQPVSNSQAGMLSVGPLPGIVAQGHYHHQQDVGSSRRHSTGGMGTRSQQQPGRMSHNMMPMQGDFGSPMEGVSHSSTRSSKPPRPDISPEVDVDERARSRPRQRSSGNRRPPDITMKGPSPIRTKF